MDEFGSSEALGLVFWFLLFYIPWQTQRWKRRWDEKHPKPDLDERGTAGEKMHGEGPAWEQDTPWVLDLEDDDEDEPQIQQPSETIVMVMPYREDDDL